MAESLKPIDMNDNEPPSTEKRSVTMEQLGLAPDPVLKRLRPVEAFLMILVS